MYTDAELIAGCKKGNRAMQKALYDTYAPRLMVVCLRYADGDEAQDILQEAMVKAFKGLENFRGESHLFYWLKRITINTALNSLRGKINMLSVTGKEAMTVEKNWDAVDEFELTELLEMIQTLPSGCRTVFNLYVIEGFKHEEIAEQLGVTVGTSKSQLSRAKLLMQEKLKREELRSHG
jgi:RNA polymerase sigma-70 factor (ECF subfamily)